MKKISILLLALVIATGLAACGRNNDTGTTDNSMTILPTSLPTMDTNIPDPEIDTQMPMYTEGTGTTNMTIPGSQTGEADKK